MPIEIIVGLPHLCDGPLLKRAIAERLPVLVSANAFSRWTNDRCYPHWNGWNLAPLSRAHQLPAIDLDSAGFVAHVRYGGFPWSIDQYFQLVKSFPFRRYASLDYCVEQEIAHDRSLVLDRISRTINANRECWRRADDHNLLHSFMPVLQGRTPHDYERCADSLWSMLTPGRVIGVGSMCRRPVNGPEGLLAVAEHLHHILPNGVMLHLFGVKGQALSQLAHLSGRITSIDSQAYGVAARQDALKKGISKSNLFLADHMTRWVQQQKSRAGTRSSYQIPLAIEASEPTPINEFERYIADAREEFRELIRSGDLDHDEDIERWTFDIACEKYAERHTTPELAPESQKA